MVNEVGSKSYYISYVTYDKLLIQRLQIFNMLFHLTVPYRFDRIESSMIKQFADDCAETFNTSGQEKVIEEAPKIVEKIIDEMNNHTVNARDLREEQCKAILNRLQRKLDRAIDELRVGPWGWQYLAALIGSSIALVAWGGHAAGGCIWLVSAGTIVGGLLPYIATAALLTGIAAIVGYAIMTAYRWIVDKVTRDKIREKIRNQFDDAVEKLGELCSNVTGIDYGHGGNDRQSTRVKESEDTLSATGGITSSLGNLSFTYSTASKKREMPPIDKCKSIIVR